MSYRKSRAQIAKSFLCIFFFIPVIRTAPVPAQAPGQFRLVSHFKDIGLVLATTVGPGPTPGTQRLYASIAYSGGTFDILVIDPQTGGTTVLRSPIAGETAAWDMVAGPDGNVYIGTAPNAHFLKLDTAKGTIVDLGNPSSREEYIWAVAFGSDGRLYGGTYPNCRLVRFDLSTGRLEDLGKLDSTQQYARYLAGTRDGFIYAGIGSAAAKVVAYQIGTGKSEQILPEKAQGAGFAHTYVGTDGEIYGLTSTTDFRISGWEAKEIAPIDVPDPAPRNLLSDGRAATLDEENGVLVLHLHYPGDDAETSFKLDYAGEPNQLFRIGVGPDGKLYGSGALPSDLVRIRDDGNIDYIGGLGNGEAYSMVASGPNLVLGTYADLATLVSYNPHRSFSTSRDSDNPKLVSIPDGDICWRPQAMIAAPNGRIYAGAQAGYGVNDGPLIEWNPADGTVRHWTAIPGQGVVSLAGWKNLVVGGTTIHGGPGSKSGDGDARLFLWDRESEEVVWNAAPVSGAKTITDLVTAPNGLIYGFADSTLFEFDPSIPGVLRTQRTGVSGLIYNSIGVDGFGRILGLSREDVFTIDTVQLEVKAMGVAPAPITGGFALSDERIYFIAGTAVYSYGLPAWGFELQNETPNASVIAGGAAQFTLTVASKGGFKGTVSLTCGGLPRGTACSFRPQSVAANATSRLTISTTAPAATATLRQNPGPILGLAAPCLYLAFAGIGKGRRKFAAMLLAVAVMQVLSGCAAVTLNPHSAVPVSGETPPGTYTIIVSATSTAGGTSMTQASLITLTVK